ncbi:hypothetical protein [Ottowia sp.]|uniref:hypothetical protein n=1 Tax=Ottowia sp. TaxID=1898956 RepID=UPI0025CFD697|nr:hypothetical protein [Ottowia sp.]MBK6616298.1 hypothetical protein [Ottowia sp.]
MQSRTPSELGESLKEIAKEMMRASWATGSDASWQPAFAKLEAVLALLLGHTLAWQPIESAPHAGGPILVDDTNEGNAPWAAAKWLGGEEWSGWVYDDDLLNDAYPLGPQPTRWLDVGQLCGGGVGDPTDGRPAAEGAVDMANERKMSLRAFEIADESMFELLMAHGSPGGDDESQVGLVDDVQGEVSTLAEASPAIREAVEWLEPRGFVTMRSDGSGQYVAVLKRPGACGTRKGA